MLRHVGEAGVASARRLGPKVCATDGERDAARALRRRVTEVLDVTATPDRVGTWPVRYAARCIGWRACDHANESEDRAT
jgi:hypothetical protein